MQAYQATWYISLSKKLGTCAFNNITRKSCSQGLITKEHIENWILTLYPTYGRYLQLRFMMSWNKMVSEVWGLCTENDGLIFGQCTLNQCGTVGNDIEKDNKNEANCFTVGP